MITIKEKEAKKSAGAGVVAAVRKIYVEAERTEPDDATIDAWLYEADLNASHG